ncbi:MAG: DUF1552 domain-containing protein [Myxococcota bacterium]
MRLSRRTMLRGCIGGSAVAVGLPLLEAMIGPRSAHADEALDKPIFGVCFWANGIPWHGVHGAPEYEDLWTPAQTGQDFTPSDLLVPLANHDFSVITGLQPQTDGGPTGLNDGHMRGFMCAMTSDMVNPDGFDHPSHTLTAMRESIDQYVAKHDDFYASGVPRFRSLQTGVSTARFHDYGHWNAISYNGPDSLNIPISSPSQLFNVLFDIPDDALALERRATVMDAVMADATRLQNRVGAADKQRLEEHFTHLSEVQRRLELSAAPCDAPAPPSDTEDLLPKTQIMGELLAIAMQCDLTRVFTMMLTSPATTHVFVDQNVTDGMHKTVHDGLWQETYDITYFHMQLFAALLDELRAKTDISGGTVLDRSLILGLSEYAEGWGHSVMEMPALIAGGACGRLTPNVHVRETTDRNFARVHLTALRGLGLDVEEYGFSSSETTSAFGDILPA